MIVKFKSNMSVNGMFYLAGKEYDIDADVLKKIDVADYTAGVESSPAADVEVEDKALEKPTKDKAIKRTRKK